MGELTARQTSWKELFQNDRPFVIPVYQRPYAWNEEDVEDFCTDLGEARDEALSEGGLTSKPFFGSIVTKMVKGEKDEMHDMLSIIDGQQRLTSFYMTMHLVVEEYKKLSREEISEENDLLIEETVQRAEAIESQQLWYNFITPESQKKLGHLN